MQMSYSTIEGACKSLIKKHKTLGKELKKIPLNKRKLYVRITEKDGNIIAKPRFDPPEYEWNNDSKLKIKVRKHLAEIYILFNLTDFEYDKEVLYLVDPNNINTKHSIIFLLEKDVWRTDEVYGDYIIERNKEKNWINICYFRRNEKRKCLEPLNISVSDDEIKRIIAEDAKNQIIKEFEIRWNKIYHELEYCLISISQNHSFSIKDENIKSSFDKISNIINCAPEYALMALGMISERCVLKLAGFNSFNDAGRNFKRMLDKLRKDGKITDNQSIRLMQLREQYNKVKHEFFSVSPKTVITFYNEMKKWEMFQA